MSRTIELMSPNREFGLVISDTEVTLNHISPQSAGASNAQKKSETGEGDDVDEPPARQSNRNMQGSIT